MQKYPTRRRADRSFLSKCPSASMAEDTAADRTFVRLRLRLGEQDAEDVGDTAGVNAENEQVQNLERELAPMIAVMKRVGPFVLLLLLRFISEHAVGIGLILAFFGGIVHIDSKFREQVSRKSHQSIQMLLALAGLCVVLIVIMYVSVAVLDAEPVWKRLVFMADKPPMYMSLLDVLWKVCTTDLMVQAIFMLVKIMAATWGQCRFCVHSSAASCSAGCRFEYLRWARGFGSYLRVPTQADAPASATADLEAGEPGWSARENRSDHAPGGSADHVRKKRLLNVIDAVSRLYRLALPTPIWLQYYSVGQTTGMFVPLYLFCKARHIGSELVRVFKVVAAYVTNRLEHGRYLSREELARRTETDCTICYDAYHRPVLLPCGHVFCEECIYEWLDRETTCPVCRATVPSTMEVPGLQRNQRPVLPQLI